MTGADPARAGGAPARGCLMRRVVPLVALVPALAFGLASPCAAAPAPASSAPPAAASPAPAADPVATLVARTLGPTPIASDLAALTDGVGGRPTGSPALDRAVQWAMDAFRAAGLEPRIEAYNVPLQWLPRVERLEVEGAPDAGTVRTVRAVALPLAKDTPADGLAAELIDAGAGDDAAIAALGASARGKLLLVHTEPMATVADLFGEYLRTPPLFAAAATSGAAGIVYLSNRPGRLLYRHPATLDGTIAALPAVMVDRENGLLFARRLAAGERVRAKLTVTSDVRRDAPAHNVVAEIRGASAPGESVLLGAHLDSWDLGRGALDNGCNAALVIDAARQIKALAAPPRATLRFALYSGEELGLWGSWGEVRTHRDALDGVRAQIVFDEGSGRTTGFSLGGRTDLASAVDRALAPLAGLGPFVETPDAFVGTDNYDYLLEGVPTLVANQDGAPYLRDYHAESDTFDKVDVRELKLNTAIAAALAWQLADAPARPAPRQTRAEVEALLKATGLDAQMKVFGVWDAWASGARGRAR